MRRVIVCIIVSFFCSIISMAQNSVKVESPNIVALNEQFSVTFIIEGENSPTNFDFEQGDDFQLVWGPQRGISTSTSIINGKKTKSSQTTYTYILMPKKPGIFRFPIASAVVKGNTILSDSVSIEVVQGDMQGNTARDGGNIGGNSSSNGNINHNDLFLRLDLSKTKVVVGEPITAVLKLYQRVDIAGFDNARFPKFNGFWSQEIGTTSNIEFQRENLDNIIYNTAVIRKYLLIPQQTGNIEIESAEIMCLVNLRTPNASNSIFGDLFQDSYRTIRKSAVSPTYKIKVSPLPSGSPKSFGGGVGKFSISSRVTKRSLKMHDAASLIISVSGQGNVALLDAPKISFPPDFEVYDVKISDISDKNNGGLSGTKTFEYPFIPRSDGKFTIPSVDYSYYDVDAGKYITLHTDAINIDVEKNRDTENATSSQVMLSGAKDVKDLNKDIRFINTKIPKFKSYENFFVASPFFFILLTLIVILGILCYFSLNKLLIIKADKVGSKNRKASKMAIKRLRQAGEYLKKDQYNLFYEELHRALLGYVSDKFNMDMREMNKENIASELKDKGIKIEDIEQFTSLLEACDFARYSPSAGQAEMAAHYERAINAITAIEAGTKKGRFFSVFVSVLIFFLEFFSFNISATENISYLDSLWNKGVTSYSEGNWESSLDAFNSINKAGIVSAELFYNMANSYVKNLDYSHAILYYERALKINPSYFDAQYNLDFVNSLIKDKIEPIPEFILKTGVKNLYQKFNSNLWAAISLIMVLIGVFMLNLFFLASKPYLRRVGFYISIIVFILAVSAFLFSDFQKKEYYNRVNAIVMKSVVSVKSSPSEGDTSKDLFILHEGTKVKLLDEVGRWKNIELADGRQGWILSEELEII